jgi:hypothetical protein
MAQSQEEHDAQQSEPVARRLFDHPNQAEPEPKGSMTYA